MNVDMDSIIIDINSTVSDSGRAIDTLVEKLNTLKDALSNVGRASNEFKTLSKNLSSGSSAVSSIRARQNTKTPMPSLEEQTSKLGVGLDSKDIVTSIKSVNSEFTKYKNELGQVVTVQRKMKDGMDQYKVSVKDTIKQTSAFEKFKDDIKSTVSNIAQMYFGLTRAWGTMGDLVETSSEYTEAVNLFYTEMGTKSREAEKWVKRFSDALYLDPKDVMQYMGAFNSLISGLGVGVDNSYKMSKNLTQLAYDLASYKNISFEQAYDKLSSGIAGQIKGLRQVGVALSQNTLQELANEMGIKTRVKEMDEASKAQLRYIQIMRTSTNWQGDLGKTMMSTENILKSARQQWTLMTRALGDLAAVVVRAVMPYFIALTQLIKEAAVSLAKFLGVDINFSDRFKNSDIQNTSTGIGKINDGIGDIGSSAKKAKKEINSMLAPFDDLNVVQNKIENAGSGGSGSGVGGASIGDLDLPEYDALSKLTSEWSDKIAAAKQKIKDLLPLIKKIALAIAAVWAIGKIAKFIRNLQTLGTVFKTLLSPLGKVSDGIKLLIGRFLDGYNYSKALGGKGLTAVLSGTRNLLSPLSKLSLTLVGAVASFTTGYVEMKSYAKGTEDLKSALIKTTAVTTAFGIAAFALVGWPATLAIGIAGLTGALEGYRKGLEEVKVHNAVFNKQGVAINDLSNSLQATFDKSAASVLKYADTISGLRDKYTSAKSEMDNARDSVDSFMQQLTLQDGKISQSQISELKNRYDQLRAKTNEARAAHDQYHIAIIKSLDEQAKKSNESTNKQIDDYKKLQRVLNEYEDEYTKAEFEIRMKRAEGKISQEEYNKAIEDLKVAYGLALPKVWDTSNALTVFNKNLGEIDYKSVQETDTSLKNLKTSMTENVKKVEEYRDGTKKQYDEEIKQNKTKMEMLELAYGGYDKLSGKQKEMYDNLATEVANLEKREREVIKNSDNTIKEIQGSYKGYIEGVYADLVSKGADTSSEFKGTMKTVRNEIKTLENVDASGAGKKIKDTLIAGVIKNKPEMVGKVGIELRSVGSDGGKALEEAFLKQLDASKPKFVKDAEEKLGRSVGKGTVDGVKKGVDQNKNTLDSAGNNVGKFLEDATRKRLGIQGGTSTVFEDSGKNVINGLTNGIKKNEKTLLDATDKSLSKLTTKTSDTMKKMKFDINTSSFKNSLNGLLGKLQSFSDKFRSGANSLLSSFTVSMNGVKVGKDNKVYYTQMPYVAIPRFEQGGYPDSGSLFWANENGIPEMIGQIGNKTAVANNDQITTAITNALVSALSGMNFGGQGTTVVNIGNKKVYEGIGEYINNENERYGTSYITI